MGVFEWNTVSNTFVRFFPNITGYVSVAPGDDEVLVVGYDSNVNVLKPQGVCQDPSVKGNRLLCSLCGRTMYLSTSKRETCPHTTSCTLAADRPSSQGSLGLCVVSGKDTCLRKFWETERQCKRCPFAS